MTAQASTRRSINASWQHGSRAAQVGINTILRSAKQDQRYAFTMHATILPVNSSTNSLKAPNKGGSLARHLDAFFISLPVLDLFHSLELFIFARLRLSSSQALDGPNDN